ncbi:MAG TPA: NAD(P)/FAD-dependent oxidoreductase [Sporichthyaceae bacterium]|jgi:cation diffusion facilitator CzcD-associated flavoprotein CzcO|nr:NAD(P)/FAD-dependent oxidoreductase [Sporichthyaceae bacterium]
MSPRRNPQPLTTLIVGAGFAGLGTAIRLRAAGIEDVVILERGSEVGGTWRDNTYPGAACDIPSVLYSYSFAPNPQWSQFYSAGPEILRYLHHLVDEFGLRPFIRFDADVVDLAWTERSGTWTARTAAGEQFRARTAVMAPGPLSNASLPAIRGIETFTGEKIHSARWDHGIDLTGKRVAVIGTGSSAVQIIPELVATAAAVKVFQRTPGWVLPRLQFDTPGVGKSLFAKVPLAQSVARKAVFLAHESIALGVVWASPATSLVERAADLHRRVQVKDPWLRRQLTPRHRIGCKRMLISNDYYRALQQDNCKLITWPIATISEAGIRTADGIEHHVDAIVFATGFDVAKTGTSFPVTGRAGRQLTDDWQRGAYAYRSVAVSGYPNLFLTFGPNSGPGHNSALVYMESQIDYTVAAISHLRTADLHSLDVAPEVEARWNERIQQRLARTTWNSGCRSWYLTDDGFNATMFPGFATQYARSLAWFRPDDYRMIAMLQPAATSRSA